MLISREVRGFYFRIRAVCQVPATAEILVIVLFKNAPANLSDVSNSCHTSVCSCS